jgi:tripartite-type tricarboxylate transporter receptor subunit TctC
VNGINRTLFTPPETPRERREILADAMESAIETEDAEEWSEETGNPLLFSGIDETDQLLEEIFEEYEEHDVEGLIEEHG